MERYYEFTTVADIYDEDSNGQLFLARRNVKRKWLCTDIGGITGIEQVVTETGNIVLSRCKISHKDCGEKIVVGEYDKFKKLLISKNSLGYGKSV